MQKSDSIANLSMALVKAQAEMRPVAFDATNPFLKNRYATLGAVVEQTRPILAKHGLAITQFPVNSSNQVGITTLLLHESGEFIETSVGLDLGTERGKSSAQVAGSVITYLRRYSWVSILGLYAEEDTDGTSRVSEVEKNVKEAIEQEDNIWSASAIEQVMKALPYHAPNAEQATEILGLSVLPIDAPSKTIASWLKHVANNKEAGLLDAAKLANDAYTAAISK